MADVDAGKILETMAGNISDVVGASARSVGERTALVEASGSWTDRELNAAIAEARSWLGGLGVRPGDRVMIVSENCRAFVAVLLAVAGMDAWAVPVNAKLSPQEIDAIRDHCGARRLIYTVSVSRAARDHAKRHNAATVEAGKLGSIGVGARNESVTPEVVEGDSRGRVAAMIYTSGTTGLPKGVMLTHRNLLYLAMVSAQIRSLTPDDRLYGVLPMTHAVGLSVVLLGALYSGARLYLSTRFDPVAAIGAMEKDALTVVLGVPSMFSVLLDYAKMKGMDSLRFPALRVISSSGAPLTATVKAETEKVMGMTLHNGYGVTECSPTIAQARLDEPRTDLSVGKILPGMTASLLGADGNEVAPGEIGELRVKGPNVMKGYYHAPEDTSAVLSADGWFYTRDLARITDGHLFIVGRAKELIVRFGFNVYPAEVEAVMSAHPAVARVAVIGRAVEASDGGEDVIAFVELAANSKATADDLAEHASKNLSPYKRPTRFILLESMPVTPTGKPMKGELAKMLPADPKAPGTN
jgi:long-chain acyl-CoA synthetase